MFLLNYNYRLLLTMLKMPSPTSYIINSSSWRSAKCIYRLCETKTSHYDADEIAICGIMELICSVLAAAIRATTVYRQ